MTATPTENTMYADELNALVGDRPIKYSLRTREEWQPFVQRMIAESERAWNRDLLHETDRGVLADYLEDAGDPRADVVRQATQRHPESLKLTEHWPGGRHKDRASHKTDFGDRSWMDTTLMHPIHADPVPTVARVSWVTPVPDSPMQLLSHTGYFDHDQTRELADRLPPEHGDALHSFLDAHFGPRKEQ